ncbi:hypothetical protein M405DRAFT_170566 [Rhizopogon salebrosus TDB-379]|nr:hypothetical protein M405DRAFT_170566 [Rhizopogon salebrosus TDB-379]
MAQYVFPSTHSPYTTQQPVVYTTSSHSHHGNGGYTYGTPLRRATSVGHVYTPSPAYGYTTSQPAQFLTVPSTHHRSKSRHRHTSHGHHGHTSYPVTYAPTTPVYVQSNTTRHRSHSRSHRHPSRSHSQSHHSHSYGYNDDYYRGRTPSVGDRVRNFFGMDPSSSSYYNSYGNQGRSRHNSFSGHNNTRTGPWMFGSTNSRPYYDNHGREVDHRGRQIHRY